MTVEELPPRLTKRQIENRLYLRLRREYLDAHPVCEECKTEPSTVIHHKITRQTHLTDVSVFMACCKPCERKFHVKPKLPKGVAKGSVWLKRPSNQMPVVQRHLCQFKSSKTSCWGTAEFRHVFKGTQHVASYWLCGRHRDMLLWGGQKLAIPTV